MQRIRQIVSGALHYEPIYNWTFEEDGKSTSSHIGTINEEFENYLKNLELEPGKMEEIRTLGTEYLSSAMEEQA